MAADDHPERRENHAWRKGISQLYNARAHAGVSGFLPEDLFDGINFDDIFDGLGFDFGSRVSSIGYFAVEQRHARVETSK